MFQLERAFHLSFEERPGYLYAHVAAEKITPGDALEYWREIGQKCSATHSDRLLLVRDVPYMMKDVDLRTTTSGYLKMVKSTKVAVVNPHRSIREDMKFALMIAMNGGGNFNIFDTEEEAERWLEE
ncbi:MAG: hypothetical protein ABJA02_09425 [Acidobacteriota bacterium]